MTRISRLTSYVLYSNPFQLKALVSPNRELKPQRDNGHDQQPEDMNLKTETERQELEPY